jgi:hypothetical protein
MPSAALTAGVGWWWVLRVSPGNSAAKRGHAQATARARTDKHAAPRSLESTTFVGHPVSAHRTPTDPEAGPTFHDKGAYQRSPNRPCDSRQPTAN